MTTKCHIEPRPTILIQLTIIYHTAKIMTATDRKFYDQVLDFAICTTYADFVDETRAILHSKL